MIRIAVMFLNGGYASTATLPVEIFLSAGVLSNVLNGEAAAPLFDVTTASCDGAPVRTDRHLSLTPETGFAGLGTPDLVFVPAGGLEVAELARHGYDIDTVVARNAAVIPWLRRWHAAGSAIAAVCSGVALVAEAGLLDGRRATAHWGLAERYRARFPAVDWRPEYLVTDHDRLYCGGGLNAAADLALYLVEKFAGREAATRCARAMLIEMPRTWQTAFTHFCPRAPHHDEAIQRAEEWLHRHHAGEVRLDALAARLGMSPRNFARRFRAATGETPLGYLHGLRIARAKRLLENSRLGIQEVAGEVGYNDLLFFRRLFRRHTGMSPSDYRRRFGAPATVAGLAAA